MSAIEGEFEDVFAGRPDQLEPRATDLVTAADAIRLATESLRALVDGQTSLSTDAVAELASQVARSLSRARQRYRKTGEALQNYAVELRPIQADARTALGAAAYYEQKTWELPGLVSQREGDLLRAEAADAHRGRSTRSKTTCGDYVRRSPGRTPRSPTRGRRFTLPVTGSVLSPIPRLALSRRR